MGCCAPRDLATKENAFLALVRAAIEKESLDVLKSRISLMETHSDLAFLNLASFQVKSFQFSALAFAFYLGNLEAFRYLYENKGLSVVEMEKNLQMNQLSGLTLVCEKNYSDLLEFYIPVYLKHFPSMQGSGYSTYINSNSAKTGSFKTPVQLACEEGHVSILITIHNVFQHREKPPFYLDLHYIDETSGENCVFIACRQRNYLMLRCLFDVIKADFSLKNFEGKGCVFALMQSFNGKTAKVTLDCLEFLTEYAGVNIGQDELELLTLVNDPSIRDFVQKKVKCLGMVEQSGDKFRDETDFEDIFELNRSKKEFSGFKVIENELTGMSSISNVEFTGDSLFKC